MPSGPPSGSRLHPAGYPIPRVPFSPFPGGPPSQPYAIPTRGPVGTGRGSSAGGHLPHQQATQHNVGTIGPNVNYPLDSPNSQPSPGGPLSQPGYVNIVRISLNNFIFHLVSEAIELCCFWFTSNHHTIVAFSG